MSNALLYRYYAADCLFAAENCDNDYRGLLVSIATAWRGLAEQDEAVAKLLAGWKAQADSISGTLPCKSTMSLIAQSHAAVGREELRRGADS
jgi:hypothetical protein